MKVYRAVDSGPRTNCSVWWRWGSGSVSKVPKSWSTSGSCSYQFLTDTSGGAGWGVLDSLYSQGGSTVLGEGGDLW